MKNLTETGIGKGIATGKETGNESGVVPEDQTGNKIGTVTGIVTGNGPDRTLDLLGTCIGCRLPWNGKSGTGYCRNAVLVIADDTCIEVTEFLPPLNKGEQKNLAETEISTGQSVRDVLIIPREQSTPGGQKTQAEPELHSTPEIIIGVRV